MAESRVEKYRDYRRSMISGEISTKTTIDTSLEATSMETNTSPTYEEALFLKKLIIKKRLNIAIFVFLLSVIFILNLVFGIILF